MELRRTEQGFALYKEKDCIGECTLSPAPKGAQLTALCILPRWRRKGYGSYLLKEVLRSFGGYDREAATVFTAPLPENAAELAFWGKFGFAAEGGQLVRRRTPDLTAVKFVQDFLAARHCRCSHVQLWLAAGGRPRGVFHRAEQHPRLAGGAAGGAPRRHRECHPVQRGGHRFGRKTGGAAFSAGTSTEKFHRSGV